MNPTATALASAVLALSVAGLNALGGQPQAPADDDGARFVSADLGDDSQAGTRDRPWKTIEKAGKSLQGGETVLILPGVYRAPKFEFKPAGKDFAHPTRFKFANPDNAQGRAVLIHPEGKSPGFEMAPYVRIEGLWIGGSPAATPEQGALGAINRAGIQVVGCTFWGRDFQLGTGNTACNILVANNLLMHMGGDWLHHPIYVAGGPPPTTQDCRFIGNVILNGGGFALHCWHQPKNITLVGNFTSGQMVCMVAQGPGHVIHHNVFWKPKGKPGRPDWNWNAVLPNDVLRFDHNLVGSDHPIREGGKPEQPPLENYSLAGIRGTQVDLIPLPKGFDGRLPLLESTEREVDAAIGELDAYFSQRTPEEMAKDTTNAVDRCLSVLRVKYRPTEQDLGSRPIGQAPPK